MSTYIPRCERPGHSRALAAQKCPYSGCLCECDHKCRAECYQANAYRPIDPAELSEYRKQEGIK